MVLSEVVRENHWAAPPGMRGSLQSQGLLGRFIPSSPRGDNGPLSVGAAIMIVGQEQRPYRLGEAARQPEPLRCPPRKTRPHGVLPAVVKRALPGSSDRRAFL